ncbi:hypothetical protein BURPSS13_V0181 [Burkholderia pseudomallei S13]|nr:hypothetical protein BURPSS13_V0181 [Burkholderia pseudomallei S13]
MAAAGASGTPVVGRFALRHLPPSARCRLRGARRRPLAADRWPFTANRSSQTAHRRSVIAGRYGVRARRLAAVALSLERRVRNAGRGAPDLPPIRPPPSIARHPSPPMRAARAFAAWCAAAPFLPPACRVVYPFRAFPFRSMIRPA